MNSVRNAARGYVQMTGITSAKNLAGVGSPDPAIPSDATMVLLVAEAQAIRWRDDGVDPTSSVGQLLPVNTPLEYTGPIANLRVIAAVSGAILNVSYYKIAG